MSALEIVLARSLTQLIIILPIIAYKRFTIFVKKEDILTLLCMGLSGYFNIVVTYFSLEKIPLSDTLFITFTSPVFAAVFSYCILKEKVHWFDAVCGIVSFIGVLLVARPSFIFGSNEARTVLFIKKRTSKEKRELIFLLGVFYALLGGIFLAMYFVMVRKLTKTYNQLISIFYPSLFGLLLTPCIMYASKETFVLPTTLAAGVSLASVGLISSIALIFLTIALRYEQATLVSLIRNLDVIYAFILQYFVMSIKPCIWSIAGGVVIIIATSFIVLRKSGVFKCCKFSKSSDEELLLK